MHQLLVLGVLKLDNLAGVDVDQMVVVAAILGGLVPGPPAAEITAVQDALFFEQPDGPIDGRNRDVLVQRRGSAVQFLDVGMIPASDRTRATTLRWPVIFRPRSMQRRSMRDSIRFLEAVFPARPSPGPPEAPAYNASAGSGKLASAISA